MCGRFTQSYTWAEIHAFHNLIRPANLQASWNIAPTQEADVVLPADGGGHELARARWGLVPAWWKKELKELPATFNARAETVAEKPMFRAAFKERRCVIPASGFYEWTGKKGDKQPWFISAPAGGPLSFAGLWEQWRKPDSGEELRSATIIVCAANGFMEKLHNRMPVILDAAGVEAWLAEPRHDLLVPANDDVLTAWPVDRAVNKVSNQGSELVEAVGQRLSDL